MENLKKLLWLGLYVSLNANITLIKSLKEGFSPEEVARKYLLSKGKILEAGKRELEKAYKNDVQVYFYEEFHEGPFKDLKFLSEAPLFLYVKGRMKNFENSGIFIGIIGTRRPTPYGKEVAEFFVPYLVRKGVITVSGMARGIDSLVHWLTIKEKGKTIAFLGSGLDVIYPSENRNLFERICEEGLVVSEFPFGTKPRRENFPRRNRLISGISKGILVIEAGIKSGTLITVNYALSMGKDVFAVPGSIFSEQSQGTHFLLKNGAICVTHPEEILEYFGISFQKSLPFSDEEEEELSEKEKRLLDLVTPYPVSIEELFQKFQEETKGDVTEFNELICELELKEKIKILPGKMIKKG